MKAKSIKGNSTGEIKSALLESIDGFKPTLAFVFLSIKQDRDAISTKEAELIQQSEMPDAEALVMFSCIGRFGEFGPLISDEIKRVKNTFNVPMAGFFCYGEFGRGQPGQ